MIDDSTFLWVLIRAYWRFDAVLYDLVDDLRLTASMDIFTVFKVFYRTGRPHELL